MICPLSVPCSRRTFSGAAGGWGSPDGRCRNTASRWIARWSDHLGPVRRRNRTRPGALLEPDAGAAAVGVEAFEGGEGFDDGGGFLQRFFVEADDARAALEHVDGEAGEAAAGAAGGQRVARAGEKIARGDR